MVNFHIVYKILLFYIQGVDFTIGNSLFGSAKLTKNIDSENIIILYMVLDSMDAEVFH